LTARLGRICEADIMQPDRDSEYIQIVVLENGIEAQLIGSILDQRDIPYRIRSYHDTAYDGLFQFQKGWGKLLAPASHRQEILAVIEEVRSTDDHRPDHH
jgi:hypothetical protein